MKSAALGLALFGAAVSRGDVTSDWTHAQDQYSPPVLANGDLCGLFDYRNMMGQDHPSYRFIKCTGGLYRPSIYREGRRTDNRKLACLGRIEERVAIGGAADVRPTWWRQRLETRDAISVCENRYADGTRIDSEAFVHSDRPVIAVRKSFSGPPPDRYTFEYLLVRPDSADAKPLHTTWAAKGDELRFTVERDSTNTLHGTVRLVCDRAGAKTVPTARGLAVTIEKPRGDVAFFLSFSDDFRGRTETPAEVSDWASLRADHVTKWNTWTDRSFVRIPDARLKKVYDTALYNLRCWSTEWSIPVGILPSHWNGSFFGFTFFGPALGATGHEDDLRKVARYWHSLIPAARIRASRAWDDDPLAGIRFAWLPDEFGAETCGNGRWLDHVFHMGTVCHEAMTCWRYREDETFLRETVYPLLHESALFYENQSLVETDGRLIVGTCCDLERFRQPVKNAFLTTCAVISTFENAADAAVRLDVDADASRRWRTLAARLRASLPRRDGRYIPYADADERSVAVLAGLVPCETLAADDPLQRAAVYDFDAHALEVGNMVKVGSRICTWYAAWAAAAEARLGDGEGARRNLLQAAKSCGRFGEIFEMNEPGLMSIPWCSSPQGTFVQAVNDMLLQCRGDEIRIAPAVPKDWTEYSFRLKAYDDITVDCTCANGRIDYRLTCGPDWSGREKRVFAGADDRAPRRFGFDRAETLGWFRENWFGRTPVGRPADETFTENSVSCFGGQVRIDVFLRLPEGASAEHPVPVFVMGDHSCERSAPWNKTVYANIPTNAITARGYAYVCWNFNDVAKNVARAHGDLDRWADGVVAYVAKGDAGAREIERAPSDWGTIGAWAWGFSRVIDWIETRPELDARRIAVVGHSRGGKTALWAGAQDERIALTISNDSGTGGARLLRRDYGKCESIEAINGQFPSWFCERFHGYGTDPSALEHDADDLLRLVAPRLLYVASASEDAWAGPEGEFAAAKAASREWERRGLPGLALRTFPAPGEADGSGRVGYHLRPGPHKLTPYDWKRYLDFADRHLKPRSVRTE